MLECFDLKNKAIQACNERKAHLCMETLIRFQANNCDPQLTTDMMIETMESACGLGSRISWVWLSGRLFQSGDAEKRKRALGIAAQACRQGEADGCANVARMLAWWNGAGKPTAESLSDVLEWGHEGCRLGGLSSCNDYAKGLPQRQQSSDVADAHKLLEDQCSKNSEPSCVRLGREESDEPPSSEGRQPKFVVDSSEFAAFEPAYW
jgi:TPR repeat protein